jgi:tRNA pseudouridine55 synthase
MSSSNNPVDGVLLVDKAVGMTSHDVVAISRRALNMKKIGHCGTLDPLATGLLILVLGRGTKLSDLLMSEDKEYVGAMLFGQTTNTQDAEGEVLEEKPVDDLTEERIEEAFAHFTGDFYQTPPMVSAVKKDGVPLYKLARKGQEVEREPRLVHVYSHKILNVEIPEVQFQVRCSKGFYVRTYAHDIGQHTGHGAHISALRRTRSGNFHVDNAVKAADLKTLPREEIMDKVLTLPEVSRMRGV